MSKTFKKLSVVEKTTDFRKAVRVVEVPLLPPQDNEVRVKNIYAGVNATDFNITAASYFTDGKLPFDIGLKSLGVVDGVGKNVTTLKVGQAVALITNNGYSEYLYVKPTDVIPIPLVKPEFIALLICGLTATIGLDEAGRIKASDKVLITESVADTGHIAVQWAKKKGCYVIGMTPSPENAKLLKELGTDRVINYKTENLDEVLTKEYPSGIDVVWETIGGQVFETLFKHLAPKGRLVIVGGTSGYKEEDFSEFQIPNLSTKYLMGNRSLNGFIVKSYKELFPKYFNELSVDLLSGKLRIVLDLGQNSSGGQFQGIDSVFRGVEHLHSGKSSGKVIIKLAADEFEKNLEVSETKPNSCLQKILLDTRKQHQDSMEVLTSQIKDLKQRQDSMEVLTSQIRNLKQRQDSMEVLTSQIKDLKQNPIPIGFIYVQLPSQPEPKTLWPIVEWKDVTLEYAGLFFRAEGGGSASFGNIQEGSSPRLTSIQFFFPTHHDYISYNGQTIAIEPGKWSRGVYTGADSGENMFLSFLSSKDEVRPRNHAIKIWKRIK